MVIYAEEDEEQDGESPEGGTSVTEEGERDADYGSESDDHADIDEDMKEQDAKHTITIDTRKGVRLTFCQIEQAQNECQEKE